VNRTPPGQLVTNSFVDSLKTALVGIAKVGDHAIPEVAGMPYAIVYSIEGGSLSGSLANPQEDGEFVFQVQCVGGMRKQAQWLADKVRDVVLGTSSSPAVAVPLTGWVLTDRMAGTAVSGVQVDGSTKQDRLFSVPQMFTLYVTPA